MLYKVLSGILLVLLVANLVFTSSFKKERDLYKNKVQNDFNTKYLLLEKKLQISESTRRGLDNRIDSLNLSIQTLTESNLTLDRELTKVKGKYKDRTPSELEKLMVEVYEKHR